MAKRHSERTGDLESLFLRLEELVLANSGEDEFEEIFKLLIAKLWDECCGKEPRFVAHKNEADTFAAIEALLKEADRAWPDILGEERLPRLTPEHLQVCVHSLSRHCVSGSDLQVMDGFFEFLVSRTAKGAKGQFFTPRHVTELCVRILQPQKNETVIDPGCGSGGFLVHALEYVRREWKLSAASLRNYCESNLWGFDLDARAVRVARTLMILAGDGKANIMRLNSLLRPEMGGLFPIGATQASTSPSEATPNLTIEDVCRSRIRKHKGFDIVLTNPPFAGEVRENHILEGYAASQGKDRIERDVLFLERCVNLLKPGGRMAIVLPHNKFAGKAFGAMRKWLLRETQVLAVVGLGRNTFLPHTHQKASVLFARRRVQSEPARADEPIFFALSEQDGKNSKGQFIQKSGIQKSHRLWDTVKHDLDDIATAYHDFAKREKSWNGES